MYCFAKSPESKRCKSSNITRSSSRVLHPNHSVSTQPNTKTRLHNSISNSPTKMMEKMPDQKKFRQKFFVYANLFTLFLAEGGLRPFPGRPSAPTGKKKKFLRLSYFSKLTSVSCFRLIKTMNLNSLKAHVVTLYGV